MQQNLITASDLIYMYYFEKAIYLPIYFLTLGLVSLLFVIRISPVIYIAPIHSLLLFPLLTSQ